ncbi:MAG: hypothetical protein AAFR47_02200 [Pseudomonadota bacterium]
MVEQDIGSQAEPEQHDHHCRARRAHLEKQRRPEVRERLDGWQRALAAFAAPGKAVPWVTTPAQDAGTVIREVPTGNGRQTTLVKSRELRIERMGRQLGARAPVLTTLQVEAGKRLFLTWEAPQRQPEPTIRVDKSLRPDVSTVIKVEAMTEFAKAMACLTPMQAMVVRRVVIEERDFLEGRNPNTAASRRLRDASLAVLRKGLDALGQHFGLTLTR